MKQLSFDPTISALDAETSALDVETSAFGAATSTIARRSFDATISAIDAETSSLDAETATSAIARSYRRYRRGVGITLQMCNRVTNHGDMSTFSKPGVTELLIMEIWVLSPDLDVETSALDAESSAIARVTGDTGAEFLAISAIAELV